VAKTPKKNQNLTTGLQTHTLNKHAIAEEFGSHFLLTAQIMRVERFHFD
jgi:hypothetical protein